MGYEYTIGGDQVVGQLIHFDSFGAISEQTETEKQSSSSDSDDKEKKEGNLTAKKKTLT